MSRINSTYLSYSVLYQVQILPDLLYLRATTAANGRPPDWYIPKITQILSYCIFKSNRIYLFFNSRTDVAFAVEKYMVQNFQQKPTRKKCFTVSGNVYCITWYESLCRKDNNFMYKYQYSVNAISSLFDLSRNTGKCILNSRFRGTNFAVETTCPMSRVLENVF